MKKESKQHEIYEAKLNDLKTTKDRRPKKKGIINKVLSKFK